MEAALSRAVPNTDGRVMMEFAMDWLAKAGYLTVAQNLFFWGKRLRYLVSTMHDYRAGHGRAFDDIEVARSWLSAPRELHRQDRRDRFLHGWRLCSPARAATPICGLQRELRLIPTKLRVECDVKEYPGAGHAFMNDHKAPLFTFFKVIFGAGFPEPSANDARARILRFFERHLQ